ncbi:DUF4177 domain-containing protein [Gemmata sp. JC717]|uniref:DUF4177 domain-containing protein n=1 Tax=Gemmata algarum TaxID=2975278 RepID=UPI0021BAE2FA|nr:DUF4177 domain-containing protein [Gemmata algarum]MDY3551232.1 DUF4177 domain-containing protein [Gemmata algarum]
MRALCSLTTAFVVFTASAGAAPVPTEKPAPSLEGKYTLLSVSSPADRAGAAGGGFGAVAPPGGGAVVVRAAGLTASSLLAGPATFTKNEISLEGRAGTLPPTTLAMLGASAGPTTMEYTFDAAKMTIDIETVSLRGKKTKALGVVEVVGDRLIVAVGRDGDERPKNTDEAGDVTVYYFRKVPAPRTEFRIVAMTVGKEGDAEKELNRLAKDGFELVSTTTPAAADAKSAPTTVHFVLKRVVK